jgi:AraC-like DNA-binding protein
MFDLERIDESEPFSASAMVYVLADMLLSSCTCSAMIHERSSATIARSGADDILVLAYQGVPFSFELDGRRIDVGPDEIAFFDLTQPVQVRAERIDNVSLIVARRRLEPLIPAIDDVHGGVLRSGVAKDLLLAHLRLLLGIADGLPAAESQGISEATLRLVAACLTTVSSRVRHDRHAGAVSMRQLKEAIERQLTRRDFGPQDLVSQFGVSRATLYRMFEPLGGVASYITERRLRHALRVLSDPLSPNVRIKELAHDLGFTHSTAFARAFRRLFGVSPSDIKAHRIYPSGSDAKPWGIPAEIYPYLDESSRQKVRDNAALNS